MTPVLASQRRSRIINDIPNFYTPWFEPNATLASAYHRAWSGRHCFRNTEPRRPFLTYGALRTLNHTTPRCGIALGVIRLRHLHRVPGGDTLHAVPLDVGPVPGRKRHRHGTSRLELHVIGVLRFQRTLDHYAPGRTAETSALGGAGRLPHTIPTTSWWAWVVNVLKPFAFKSSTELTRSVGSDKMLPDQIPGLKGPRLRPIRSG